MAKQRPGSKVVSQNIQYKDWIAGENALKFATREQVVAFANLQLREQIVPLIRNAIIRYDRQQRANRWYWRVLRWLLQPWRPKTAQEEVQEILAEAEEKAVVGTIGGTGQPEDNGEVRKSCATCGSLQLEPVNAQGGLRCVNGHVVEEPPRAPVCACGPERQAVGRRCMCCGGIVPPDNETGRGPAGSPGGPL